MTLNKILTFDVNRILKFDVNRILRWDVGRALTRPITNPFLKFAGGWLIGILVCGVGGISIGSPPSDQALRLMGVVVGVLFAMVPNRPASRRDENANPERPSL